MQVFHIGAKARAVVIKALVLLVMWSSSTLATACDEQWVHLGGAGEQVSVYAHHPHEHGGHCPSASAYSTAVPMASIGDDQGWQSSGAGLEANTLFADVDVNRPKVLRVSAAAEEAPSPPLYLIYHRILIPFPS